MTEKEAHERFVKALTNCFVTCMDQATREYVGNLLLHSTDRQRAEFEAWLREEKARMETAVTDLFRSIPPLGSPAKGYSSRAQRLQRESQLRRGFFKWARGFIRKPGAGGRPRKLAAAQAATIVRRVSGFLAEGSTRQDAFEAAGRPFNVSVSTVRCMWIDFMKTRKNKTAASGRGR